MTKKIRVLIAEDNPDDAELALRALRHAGFEPEWQRVETEADYVAHLREDLDVIIADYLMPQFTVLRALELLNGFGLKIPFIIVSGMIGEDTAVAAMQLGATDYLLKDRLARLGAAVTRALEQKRLLTEREAADRAHRESEQRFRQITEAIREVFWLSEPDKNRILYVSPAYETIWGRSCESLLISPRAWLDSIHDDDREKVSQALEKQTAGAYDEEYRVVRPDGTTRWVRDRAVPVRDESGAVFRIAGVAEDITERKQLEAQFLRVQRLEAIGTLAGGVAHDLNNILAPILMAAGVIKETAESPHEREMLGMIEQSAQRGADIIWHLLTFSRGIEGARVIVQLRHLLLEIGTLIRETFPREIALELHAPRVWGVRADATQLHQVLLNLCVNARDAMPAGGTLTVSVQNLEVSAAAAAQWPEAAAGPHVVVTVQDTGTGIPPEVIGRIFDPFFTTKGLGKGTGLGLSTVIGIVRSHGGFVTAESEMGKGATFKIYLRAEAGTADKAAASPEKSLPKGKGEWILVVDDEEQVRDMTRRVLEKHSYQVLAAGDGREAIHIFLAHRGVIKVVLTDVMMPVMGGKALVRTLRVLDPQLKIVATSGMEEEGRMAELEALGVTEFLAKPCSANAILGAVRRLLE